MEMTGPAYCNKASHFIQCLSDKIPFRINKTAFSAVKRRRLLLSQIAVLIQNIWSVIMRILFINAEQPFVTGIFENRRYYCQVYHLFGIPALIIMTALITRQWTAI